MGFKARPPGLKSNLAKPTGGRPEAYPWARLATAKPGTGFDLKAETRVEKARLFNRVQRSYSRARRRYPELDCTVRTNENGVRVRVRHPETPIAITAITDKTDN